MGSSLSNFVNILSQEIQKIWSNYGCNNKRGETCWIKYEYSALFLEHANFKDDLIVWKYLYYDKNIVYVIIMSHKSFRVNLQSIVCLNVKELLAWRRRHIWSLRESNGIRIHNHLVSKWTLNHLSKLANSSKCLTVR